MSGGGEVSGETWEPAGAWVNALVNDILVHSDRDHYRRLVESRPVQVLARVHSGSSGAAWLDVCPSGMTVVETDDESSPLVGDRFGSDGGRYAALFHWTTGAFILQLDSDVPGESSETIARSLFLESQSEQG